MGGWKSVETGKWEVVGRLIGLSCGVSGSRARRVSTYSWQVMLAGTKKSYGGAEQRWTGV